jgi:hypothetical protein
MKRYYIKTIIFVLAALLTFSFTACGSKTSTASQTAVSSASVTNVNKKTATDVNISYPVTGNTAADKIIKAEATAGAKALGYSVSQKDLTLEVKYKIYHPSADVISVMYYGNAYIQGNAYPVDFSYAVTVNKKTGKKVPLSTYVTSSDKIVKAINASGYKVISGGLQEEGPDMILQYYNTYAQSQLSSHYYDYYVTEKNIYIIISGLGYDMGDYSVIRFSR